MTGHIASEAICGEAAREIGPFPFARTAGISLALSLSSPGSISTSLSGAHSLHTYCYQHFHSVHQALSIQACLSTFTQCTQSTHVLLSALSLSSLGSINTSLSGAHSLHTYCYQHFHSVHQALSIQVCLVHTVYTRIVISTFTQFTRLYQYKFVWCTQSTHVLLSALSLSSPGSINTSLSGAHSLYTYCYQHFHSVH